MRDGSNDVLVGQAHFSNLGDLLSVTPKRLDVSTGRASADALGYPEHATHWVFDGKGVARVATLRRRFERSACSTFFSALEARRSAAWTLPLSPL